MVLTSNHNLCFEQKYENCQNLLSENFPFLVVKFSIFLNRRVFVMVCLTVFLQVVFSYLDVQFVVGPISLFQHIVCLIYMKMPTIVGIFIFISREKFMLS